MHNGQPGIWYLRYRDNAGRWCKAKATTDQVLRRLREGRFSGNVEASHHHGGEFQPLGSFAEFAPALTEAMKGRKARGFLAHGVPAGENVVKPSAEEQTTSKSSSPSKVWLFASLGIVVAIVATVLVRMLLWP